METDDLHLPGNHQDIVDRFITACQADERIVAAFLGGSYATGKVDQYSDLDMFCIIADAGYEDFLAEKERFIRLLGEPLFLDDFGVPNGYYPIFANGSGADIEFYRESQYKDTYSGPFRVLLDKKGILAGVVFPSSIAGPAKQVEVLRHLVEGFWHDLSHFIKALGRKQLWFAYGELEILRHFCVNLARLNYNFADPYVGNEPYFKVDQFIPAEQLAPLAGTICPLEHGALLQAGLDLFRYYRDVAPALARAHGLTYQVRLEQLMLSQLEELLSKFN